MLAASDDENWAKELLNRLSYLDRQVGGGGNGEHLKNLSTEKAYIVSDFRFHPTLRRPRDQFCSVGREFALNVTNAGSILSISHDPPSPSQVIPEHLQVGPKTNNKTYQ